MADRDERREHTPAHPAFARGASGASPRVTLETTSGALVVELSPAGAPQTVANFLAYVRAGYYAGVVFHRVIKGFVAQAGGYTESGARKPPLFPPLKLETSPLKHTHGALGMARLPEPNSATSEFYFCDGDQRELDRSYCVFGRLVAGEDALRRILDAPTRRGDWPVDPPVILRAYEGDPDPANLAPKHTRATHGAGTTAGGASGGSASAPAGAAAAGDDADTVRQLARRLKGRAALFRSKRPLLSLSDVEAAIAAADRSGRREDLERAERLLAEKEKR